MSQAKVVLATCHGAGGRQIQNSSFDVVVIDEAAQALEVVRRIECASRDDIDALTGLLDSNFKSQKIDTGEAQ